MMSARNFAAFVLFAAVGAVSMCGCNVAEPLHPRHWPKLNRGPDHMPASDYHMFSSAGGIDDAAYFASSWMSRNDGIGTTPHRG